MTHRPCFTLSLLLAAAAIGCGSDSGSSIGDEEPGGQTGEETVGCLPVEGDTRALAWSQRSSLGFSADEVLGTLGASRDTRLDWSDGSTTTLGLELTRRMGSVEFQNREWQDDGSGRELAAGTSCSDVLVVPVSLSFSTGDGAFAETWDLELEVATPTRATAYYAIALDTLQGDYTVTEVNPSSFDSLRAFVAITLTADAWSGRLDGQGASDGSSGPDGNASAQQFGIATF
jgi:hypothetical protein